MHDGYGQTETGALTGMPIGEPLRPGSMGRPLPGFRLWVEEGELCADPATIPTFFLDGPEGTWRTGDRVREDEDGYLWFEGRTDDVIISAGYRIGPFEVESALVSHPAVAEAAAVAAPDEERGQVVRAVVVLRAGHGPGERLARELQEHVKERTAPYKYPRIVEFAERAAEDRQRQDPAGRAARAGLTNPPFAGWKKPCYVGREQPSRGRARQVPLDIAQVQESPSALCSTSSSAPRHPHSARRPRGDLDAATNPAFRRRDPGAGGRRRRLVLDLSEVSFMSAGAIGVIARARTRMERGHGRLFVICPSPRLYRLFEIAGLAGTLDILASREALPV